VQMWRLETEPESSKSPYWRVYLGLIMKLSLVE
jgi:hypothetical protein